MPLFFYLRTAVGLAVMTTLDIREQQNAKEHFRSWKKLPRQVQLKQESDSPCSSVKSLTPHLPDMPGEILEQIQSMKSESPRL